MIPHTGRRFTRLLLLIFLLTLLSPVSAVVGDLSRVIVRNVVDGDTLVLSSGERVRLLGLDAPEPGEAYSEAARKRLYELIGNGKVGLQACPEKDRYGRILAVVRVQGKNVNRILLEEGLAVPMLIPPCGKMVAGEVLEAARSALEAGRGIYALEEFSVVGHEEAGNLIGQKAVVRGVITSLHRGEKAWHLNFGEDWRTDFTAVIFRQGRVRFDELGFDPEKLVGKEVLVIGRVKSFNGPEIIIRGPEQIIPVE